MPLIKTIAEVKAVLRISSLDDDMSLPDIAQAEEKRIIPAIGEGLYDEILAAYNGGDLTAPQTLLLPLLQKPIAAYAYLDDLALIHATINDRGVSRIQTGDMPAAYRWEYNEVKATLEDKALTGTEQLLGFLERNKDQFPSWTASDAYKRYHQFLITTGPEFNDHYPLDQPRRTFMALRPILDMVEEMYLKPAIGEDFLQELKDNDPPAPEAAQIITLLKKALAFLSIRHAIESLSVRFTHAGFTVISDAAGSVETTEAGRKVAPDKLLILKMEAAERDGQNFLNKAVRSLNLQASDTLFSTFKASDRYRDPTETLPATRGNDKRKNFRF